MSLKERTINIDIMTKGYTKLKYKQGDSNQILNFKFFKNGSELDLTGYVAGIFYEKPNNEILEKTGTINTNTVTTTITSGVLNTTGIVKTEIFLTKDDEVSISFTILIEVEASINKNAAVQEKEEWDAIKDLLIKSNNLAMIDDNNVSNKTTSSSYKINSQLEDIKNDFNSQIKEKANSSTVTNMQNQINNLVLGAVGNGNNAEVIQARGHFGVLNDRLNDTEKAMDNLKDTLQTEIVEYELDWENGGLNSSGEFTSTTQRIRTTNYIQLNGNVYIHGDTNNNIQIYWYKFDGELNFVECSDDWKYGTELKNTGGYYYRFALKYISGTDINVGAGANARVFQVKRINNVLINEIDFNYSDFEKGGIDTVGNLTKFNNMYRTNKYYKNINETMYLVNPANFSYSIHYYDLENGQYVHKDYIGHDEINGSSVFILPKNKYEYFKLVTRLTVTSDYNVNHTEEHLIKLLTNLRLFSIPCLNNISTNSSVPIYNNPLFSPYRFKLQAHRGFCNEYPENTVISFEQAGKTGAYAGMETDVQRTSDGVFVIMHDDTIDRTTNGTGAVSDYTYAELQELYIDGGYGWSDTYANQLKIPTLLDYLKVCRKYNLIPYIEIKLLDKQGLEDLITFLNQQGFKGRCVLTSFKWSYLEYIANITNDYPLEYMPNAGGTDYNGMIDKLSKYNNIIIRLNASVITEDIMNKFREKDILVDAYGLPVGDTATLNRLKELGVEGVTCNSYKFSS